MSLYFSLSIAAQTGSQSQMMMQMMKNMGGSSGLMGSAAGPSYPVAGLGGAGAGSSGLGGAGGLMGIISKMGGMFGGMGRGLGGISTLMQAANPFFLCKQTENFKVMPCQFIPRLCDAVSLKTYKVPGLLKCERMMSGCCLKNARAYMMAKTLT